MALSTPSDNPFLDSNQSIPYNFQLTDVSDTRQKLFFSSKLNVYNAASTAHETTGRKIVSFLDASNYLLNLGERCADMTAEYVKNNYLVFIGVGSGNVIRSKTGTKGIASLVISNRAEVLNYWHEYTLHEGDQLYFIVKQERVKTRKRHHGGQNSDLTYAWVLKPHVALRDPDVEDLMFKDRKGKNRMGSFIYVGRCNDACPELTDNRVHNVLENRATRLNDRIAEKLCGSIEIFV